MPGKKEQNNSNNTGSARKGVLNIVTPSSSSEVDSSSNVIITSGTYNAGYHIKSALLQHVVPVTSVGVGIAMSDMKSTEILASINQKQINQIRSILSATTAWYDSLLGFGIGTGLTRANDNKKTAYSGGILGLAPAMITALGLNANQASAADSFYNLLWEDDTFRGELSKMMKTAKFVKGLENNTTDAQENGLTYPRAVAHVLDHLSSTVRMEAIQVLMTQFISNLIPTLTADGDNIPFAATMIDLLTMERYAHLFSAEFVVLTLDVALNDAINANRSTLVKSWEAVAAANPKLDSAMPTRTTSVPFSSWIAMFSELVANIKYKSSDESGSLELVSGEAMTALKAAYEKTLVTTTTAGIAELLKSLEITQTFSRSLADFYASKTEFMINSYKKTDELMAEHKRFLSTLTTITEVATAREHLNRFTQSKAFSDSIAGLLYAIASSSNDIDPLLVSDILNISVNEDVIKSFKRSPFGKDVYLEQDSSGRIADYGTGVGGMTLKGRLSVDTKAVFSDQNILLVNGKEGRDVASVFSNPWNIKENQEQFCRLAMLLIGKTDAHDKIGGLTEISAYADDYGYSKAVRDEMLPTIRLINNCVGAQLFAYKSASFEWFKQQLLGYVDVINYITNYISSEKNNLRPRMFAEVSLENMKKIKDTVSDILKDMFGVTLPDVPAKVLPSVKFYIGGTSASNRTTDMDAIATHFITYFRKSDRETLRITEELKTSAKVIQMISQQGVTYKRAISPIYVKDSLFTGFSPLFATPPAEFENASYSSHLALRPTPDQLASYRKDAFRNNEGLHWFQGSSLSQLLQTILADKKFSKLDNTIISTRFGHHASEHFHVNDYIIAYAKMKAKDLLNNVSKASSQSTLRMARSYYHLNHLSQALLRLSYSPYEGMEYGLSPTAHTFTSSSDDYTLESILASIGIKASAVVKAEDKSFLSMVNEIARLGGPLVLTDDGRLSLSGAKMPATVRISDMIGLAPGYKLAGSEIRTFTFYLRTSEMQAALFNDYLIEDLSHSYDITLVEDSLMATLRSTSFDELIIAMSSRYQMDIIDIDNEDDIRAALRVAAETISDFIFPLGILSPSGSGSKEKIDEKEDEEEAAS